ncbi:hypothetical protein EYV94_11470 [Puteibacter caeruleilacunae]|nr:hypothetical protein EYV94_11470 [Puteibacter caeruleilacunae]
MNRIKSKLLLLVFAVITSVGFSQNIQFKVEKNIKGEVVVKDLIIGGPSLLHVMDSLLFVQDVRNHGNKYLKVYNIEKGTLSKELGQRGRGPGELISPMISYTNPQNQQYYLRDKNAKKVHIFNLNDNSAPDSIIDLDFFKNNAILDWRYLNDSILLGNGWFKDSLIAIINFKSKQINFTQDFPLRPFDGPSMNIGRANAGVLKLTPDKKHLLYSCVDIGYLACYKIDGIRLEKQWDRWLSKPKYKLDGKRIVYHSKDNLLGCMDCCVTNNRVYCIYEGIPTYMIGNMDPKNSPKTIITFSMKGEPLGKYHADRPIIRITPDGNGGVYCVSEDPEYNVVRYKL